MKIDNPLSRKEFLKLTGIGVGALAIRPWENLLYQADFPQAERLGRVADPVIRLRQRPDVNSPEIDTLYQDQVVPWLREVVGNNPYRYNQRWVETPDGYIWCPLLQPVRNFPQVPVDSLPQTSLGEGMWVEVTVPYVELYLINPVPFAPSVKNAIENGLNFRLYFGQVIWIDQIRVDNNGQTWYRINERYSYGDMFWAQAEAFRPLTEEDMAPISPDVEDKRVDVNISRQTVSCFEGNTEVFFARVSTGQVGEDTETTPGLWKRIWRKMVSSHMTGGTTGGGWDLAGVAWTTLFVGDGIAFHSTFWHNNFGVRKSRGCVNMTQEDARFLFRWTNPVVPYDPGDVTVTGDTGTLIRVLEE
jgi:hypothetical protein